MQGTDIAIPGQAMPSVLNDALSIEEITGQVQLIQQVMSRVMHDGEHFGKVPGCGDKPTLLKPGAEKLAMTFRFAPRYAIQEKELRDGHREYRIVASLQSITTGRFVGEGVGVGTTMESKWRFRKAEQKCPHCGRETIIKGKKEYGGGWICFAKKGGCGAKFDDEDPAIKNQNMGRVEHDNPADYYNTCLKMAKKRALVDAILTATAASDIFTQDVEDMDLDQPQSQPQAGQRQAAPAKPKDYDLNAIGRAIESKETPGELLAYMESLGLSKNHHQRPAIVKMYKAREDAIKSTTMDMDQMPEDEPMPDSTANFLAAEEAREAAR